MPHAAGRDAWRPQHRHGLLEAQLRRAHRGLRHGWSPFTASTWSDGRSGHTTSTTPPRRPCEAWRNRPLWHPRAGPPARRPPATPTASPVASAAASSGDPADALLGGAEQRDESHGAGEVGSRPAASRGRAATPGTEGEQRRAGRLGARRWSVCCTGMWRPCRKMVPPRRRAEDRQAQHRPEVPEREGEARAGPLHQAEGQRARPTRSPRSR